MPQLADDTDDINETHRQSDIREKYLRTKGYMIYDGTSGKI